MGYGKWIAGGLGWAFLGPIGGLIAFAIGSLLSSPEAKSSARRLSTTTRGDFNVSLVVLVAAVMKSDGKVMKSELDFVKVQFVKLFGASTTSDALLMLREILKKDIPVQDVSRQIGRNLDSASKLQLLHFLYAVAKSDGQVHESEIKLIDFISHHMGINKKESDSIKFMFVDNVDSAYKILEIEKSTTNDEIKKAYKKLAIKYHPDKVAYLGEDVQKAAKEKFQNLSDAYEKIKKERGFN